MEEQLFGIYLRDRRKQAGHTQRSLATASGLDFTYICKLERGNAGTRPSENALEAFAQALEVDRDELFWVAGKITPDVQKIMLDIGPQRWKHLREHYTGTRV